MTGVGGSGTSGKRANYLGPYIKLTLMQARSPGLVVCRACMIGAQRLALIFDNTHITIVRDLSSLEIQLGVPWRLREDHATTTR